MGNKDVFSPLSADDIYKVLRESVDYALSDALVYFWAKSRPEFIVDQSKYLLGGGNYMSGLGLMAALESLFTLYWCSLVEPVHVWNKHEVELLLKELNDSSFSSDVIAPRVGDLKKDQLDFWLKEFDENIIIPSGAQIEKGLYKKARGKIRNGLAHAYLPKKDTQLSSFEAKDIQALIQNRDFNHLIYLFMNAPDEPSILINSSDNLELCPDFLWRDLVLIRDLTFSHCRARVFSDFGLNILTHKIL